MRRKYVIIPTCMNPFINIAQVVSHLDTVKEGWKRMEGRGRWAWRVLAVKRVLSPQTSFISFAKCNIQGNRGVKGPPRRLAVLRTPRRRRAHRSSADPPTIDWWMLIVVKNVEKSIFRPVSWKDIWDTYFSCFFPLVSSFWYRMVSCTAPNVPEPIKNARTRQLRFGVAPFVFYAFFIRYACFDGKKVETLIIKICHIS